MITGTESYEQILSFLKNLEYRISRIEAHLGLDRQGQEDKSVEPPSSTTAEESQDALETQVGEYWFAKVGIVVLSLGVVFLLTFPYQNLPPFVPSVIGYVLVAAILTLSRYLRDSFQTVSRYLLGGGLLLLYFTTLRLSHFGTPPALDNTTLESVLLSVVTALNLVVSVRKKSVYLVGLNLALVYLTALVGGQPYFVFLVITATSVLAAYFSVRFNWSGILTLGIVLSYFTHSLWALNNPLFGNSLQLVSSPQFNVFFILLYAIVFGVGSLAGKKMEREDVMPILNSFLNGLGSYGLLTLLMFAAFRPSFAPWQLLASSIYLALAVAFWVRTNSKYVTFVYAMLGYIALSAALAETFVVPDIFVWLCWQSILVLSTAVWFRSRFIVVANFAIYLAVFFAYLSLAGTVGVISMSFGFVALLSARILNWKKDRLELKTDMMRNAYLASALFVFPYALYHVLPRAYVSLSWLGLALFYYIASRILNNNRKYRWMALLTTSLTILYVFIVDMVGVEPVWRIISFLVLGIALLAVSMIYSRRRQNK